MAAIRRAFVAATFSVLALGRSEYLSAERTSEPRNRKSGVTKNRNLASCESVEVTGGYGYTAGVYAEDGSRNGIEAYVSLDGSSQLFYSDREESDGDDRRRWRQRLRLLLPEELFDKVVDDEEEEQEEAGWEGGEGEALDRRLGACSRGFWSLAPAGDGYPQLRVSDCAQHPADIKVTTWVEVTCANCSEQTYNGDMPEVECFTQPASSPSPSPPSPSEASPSESPTLGTSTEDDDASAGGSGGTVDEGSSSGAPVDGSCKVLDVGGRYPGLYTAVGSYNGRGDYYSENLEYNIFFELDSSSEGASDDDDDDDDDDNRRVLLDEVITAHRARGGGEGGRGLAACDSGYWIKTPTGGGYPFFALADCAVYPENIAATASWLIITCDGCDAGPATSSQTIACATGEDAFVATPSPVPPVENGGGAVEYLPGSGVTTCEEVTVTGVRGGNYTVVGEFNQRADLARDDGNFRIFFTGPAPALETFGERTRRRVSGEEYRDVPFLAEVGRSRALQEDCEGFWYIIPTDAKYPTYAVWDCAYHPVDIVNTNWLYLDCEDCAVVTASPKPAVACTGAPKNVKRGGSWVTPSPAGVVDPGGVTPSPLASVSSTCQTVVITGDYPGNFTANGTYRGKPDFFNNDRTVNLYFELAVSRRALAAEDEDGQRRFFPGDAMASALTGAAAAARNLAVCTSGYWIMAPVGGIGYPVFGAPDCAQHPADIRANTWLVASCETCGVQDAPSFVAPSIACADGATGVGAPTPTPAPARESSCGVVYVTGPAAGVYSERGTQGNRGDFFSNNRVWNLYWAFYAGKPVNRNRFRRGLSEPDGVHGGGGGGRRSLESDWALQAFASGWQGEEGLRLGQPQQPQHRKGGGEASEGDGQGEGSIERRLEFCEDGFWLITPRGGGFPFYGTQNCASHPADIAPTAVWSVVECDGCGSEVSNQSVTVSCNGAGFTPPPSPSVEDLATRAPVAGIDGAGEEGAACRARPDARLAATVFLSLVVLVGVAVAAL